MNKHNKLILGSVLSLSMLFTVASCNGNQEPSNSHSDDPTTVVPPTVPETSEDPSTSEQPSENIGSKYPCISVAEAIKIATEAGETETSESYYLYGVVKSVANPMYGEMTIQDDTGEIYVYGINGYSDLENKPLAGDEIVIKGSLKTFKDKAEFGRSELIAFHHEEVKVDDKDYVAMSISESRSKVAGEKVKLTGVVAQITYGQKYIPNGFYLIDNTESIYVYDQDAVQLVKPGNKVTIIGERINYISSKETKSAEQFGYQGCIQVGNVKVLDNDKKENPIDKSWVKESTVKKILETPMSTNITTSTFKVTAYVHKQVNPGFTNYYIDDLDNKTGSYVYTSNNGSDFKWLDPYDGKLCTIYLSPINCKCTSGGCVYRFIPIELSESTYKMSEAEVPAFVFDYHVVDQFIEEYNSNPHLELLTKFSDTNLGFENATITYTSDNNDVAEIISNEEGTFLDTKNDGTANINVLIKYNNQSITKTITIKVRKIDVSDAISVKAAIDAADGTTVKVRGVVLASLVNRNGFYMADETGVIAVTTTKDELSKIQQGQMVCFEGTRNHRKKDTTDFATGQSVIEDSVLILNEYGNHPYSTATFDNTKKLEDIINLPVSEDHTTQVYVVKAKVNFITGGYSSTVEIVSTTDPESKITLYSSSADQYKWLKQFKDEPEVTLELMLCNWNDKHSYKGAVLSAQVGEKKVMNTLNFPL